MAGRILAWLAAAMLAALIGQPLQAQEPAVPRTYPPGDRYAGPPETDPVRIMQQAEDYAYHLAQCDAGDVAYCTGIGIALRRGETQPQNRPVAELLLRRACDMGDPRGCLEVAELLLLADPEDDLREYVQFVGKACDGGSLPACLDYAHSIERGEGQRGDVAAADEIRRRACAKGSEEACIRLAQSLTLPRRSMARQDEGRALFQRLCSAGNPEACGRVESLIPAAWRGDRVAARANLSAGCAAGDASACVELGKDTMRRRAGKDDAAAIAEALIYYDRACAADYGACSSAAIIREEAPLDAACRAGDRAACQSLAARYTEWDGPLQDFDAAQELLAGLCLSAPDDAQRREQCWAASEMMRDAARSEAVYDPVQTADMMNRACEAGFAQACIDLGLELMSGRRLLKDVPRGYDLFLGQCEAGDVRACNFLVRNFDKDPSTPLPPAGPDFVPVAYGGDAAEPDSAPEDEAPGDSGTADGQPAGPENRCSTTTVTYRGVAYSDTVCPAGYAVTNGTPVGAGKAPWQALIWRPKVIPNVGPVAAHQHVLCGGTVIRTGWVLTAAHCLRDNGQDIRTAGHRLRLGVSNPNVDEGVSYRITETYRHPEFTGPKLFAFDIAIIRYDPASGRRGSGPVYPVRRIITDPKPLAARTLVDRTPAFTYGWGRTQVAEGPIPRTLLSGRVLMRNADVCQRAVKFDEARRGSVICADQAKGQQACSGDSGGPLIVFEAGKEGTETPVQLGVVSMGKECGTAAVPSRFTRISHPRVRDWIADVLARRIAPDPR